MAVFLLSGCDQNQQKENRPVCLQVEDHVKAIQETMQSGKLSELPIAKDSDVDLETIQNAFYAFQYSDQEFKEEDRIFNDAYYGSFVASNNGKELLIDVKLNENYEIEKMAALVKDLSLPTYKDDEIEETIIEVGSLPQLPCILTKPIRDDQAPVILMLASNTTIPDEETRDYARMFARCGYSVVRYIPRYTMSPMFQTYHEELDFDRFFQYDIARIVHTLETFPVDASKISILGVGSGCNYVFTTAYHHFEVNGNLIFMDVPSDLDGLSCMKEEFRLKEEEINVAKQLMHGARLKDETLAGYPLDFYRRYDGISLKNYTNAISNRVLVVNQENEDRFEPLSAVNCTYLDYFNKEFYDDYFLQEFSMWMDGEEDVMKAHEKHEEEEWKIDLKKRMEEKKKRKK